MKFVINRKMWGIWLYYKVNEFTHNEKKVEKNLKNDNVFKIVRACSVLLMVSR